MSGTSDTDEYPAYLEALETAEERKIRRRIEELKAELDGLKNALEEASRAKRTLLLTGGELRDEVVRYLSEDLGLDCRRSEEDGPGFRMVDGSGKVWATAEVWDSALGTVTKEHLARMMIRRAQGGMDAEAPALIVMNAFHEGASLSEHDQPVPPDVARRASEDHILVVRTMDLMRLGQRAANGFPAGEQLTEALQSGGGWLEVDQALNATVRGAEEATPAAA